MLVFLAMIAFVSLVYGFGLMFLLSKTPPRAVIVAELLALQIKLHNKINNKGEGL